MKGITNTLNSLFLNLISDAKGNAVDYCFLKAAKTGTNEIPYFLGTNGSCASLFSIEGSKNIRSEAEYFEVVESLNERLRSSFRTSGHVIQFAFIRDPDRTEEALRDVISTYRRQGKKLGINADFLAKEKIKELETRTIFEDFFLVAWTLPTSLGSKNEAKSVIQDAINKQKELSKKFYYQGTQDIFAEIKPISDKHVAFVNLLKNVFQSVQISINLLDINESSNKIRRIFNSSFTDPEWKPLLSEPQQLDGLIPEIKNKNKTIKLKGIATDIRNNSAKEFDFRNAYFRDNREVYGLKEHDLRYFLYPTLPSQLIPNDIEFIEPHIIKILDRYIGVCKYDQGFTGQQKFDVVLQGLLKLPFLFSIKVVGGGYSNIGIKSFLSSVLAFMGSDNRSIKESFDVIKALEKEQEAIVGIASTVLTWSKDLEVLKSRVETVLKTMQSFGDCLPEKEKYDPFRGLFDAIPAMAPMPSSNKHLNILSTVIDRLPLSRQANIWNNGWIVNRTTDLKIIPFEVASKIQASWNELIFAKPGSGKSVWSNNCNFSFLLNPNNQSLDLPYLSITDIGKSSKGLIRLIRSFLPENRKHEAVYYRLQNTVEDAINIFDIHLGCRKPSPKEREFIISFLTMLLTPAGISSITSLDTMVSAIVDEMYVKFADLQTSTDYQTSQNEYLNGRFKELGIDPEGRKWWQLVDTLVSLEQYNDAKIAQRYAMPVLEDMVNIASNTNSISEVYKKVLINTGENLIDFVNRSISEAIRTFPILGRHTKLDFERSRVVSLDLNDVAPDGTPTAKKQSNVFYFLSRYITTKNFFIDDKIINCVETHNEKALVNYQKYHQERADLSLITPKRIVIDELHRTSGLPAFKHQILRDMREGRKWNLSVCVISQLVSDFDDDIIDVCNSKFIFSGGSDADKIVELFKIPSLRYEVRNQLVGPTSEGVPFVGIFSTTKGEFSQFLLNTLSPIERWAFSSTAEDDAFREKIENRYGIKGLVYLAEYFPRGSINSYLEEYKKAKVENPFEKLLNEFYDKYKEAA